MPAAPDIVIVGSGIGGATLAAGLAGSGAADHDPRARRAAARQPGGARRASAIFVDRPLPPRGDLARRAGGSVQPRQLLLCRRQLEVLRRGHAPLPRADFAATGACRTASRPAGRSPTQSWSPGTAAPSGCSRSAVRRARTRPSPRAPRPTRIRPCPTSPRSPRFASGWRPRACTRSPCRWPIDIDRWLQRAATPWDAFPDTRSGKLDAETAPLAQALRSPDVSLVTGAHVERLLLAPDGRRIEGVEYRQARRAPGAARRNRGPGRRGRELGRALLARARRRRQPLRRRRPLLHEPQLHGDAGGRPARARTTSVYQKTLGINDFYLDDGKGGPPLGNVQLLGKISGPILQANARWAPGFAMSWLARHSVDWYLMSEDLPDPESRVPRRRRDHRPRLAALQHDRASTGWSPACASCSRPPATRSCSLAPSTAARPRTSAARSASAPIPPPPPSTRSAAPTTTPTSSWSTPRSCRPRPPSTPRSTIAAQALRVADHLAAAPAPATSRLAHA